MSCGRRLKWNSMKKAGVDPAHTLEAVGGSDAAEGSAEAEGLEVEEGCRQHIMQLTIRSSESRSCLSGVCIYNDCDFGQDSRSICRWVIRVGSE